MFSSFFERGHEMSIEFYFSGAILKARTEKKLTQAQVAEGVSISVRWYQTIESGKTLPSAELVIKLFAYLEIDGKQLKEYLFSYV